MSRIYHITHIENLSGILKEKYLWCDTERKQKDLKTRGIAYEAIKLRRERRLVPTCEKGVLADYVPFYFAPRSPMLYAIHKGTVENYREGQSSVIHLVTWTEKIVEAGLPFTFTNGHAEMEPTEFYESLNDLSKIDWDLMNSNYWGDNEDDLNRKWRRQAEFLVHEKFPIELIAGIGVISEEIKEQVENILETAGINIKVAVLPSFYY